MAARAGIVIDGQSYSKTHLKARMIMTGDWQSFVEIRTEARAQGASPGEAWERALVSFPHILDQHQEAAENPNDPSAGLDSVEKEEAGVIEAAKKVQVKRDKVRRALDGKVCSVAKAVDWVAANISLSAPDVSEAPSSTAWGMLIWAQATPGNTNEFWKNIFPKLMPTRAQIEADNSRSDDGRSLLELVARVAAIATEPVLLPGAEGSGGESGLPEGDPGDGAGGHEPPE